MTSTARLQLSSYPNMSAAAAAASDAGAPPCLYVRPGVAAAPPPAASVAAVWGRLKDTGGRLYLRVGGLDALGAVGSLCGLLGGGEGGEKEEEAEEEKKKEEKKNLKEEDVKDVVYLYDGSLRERSLREACGQIF